MTRIIAMVAAVAASATLLTATATPARAGGIAAPYYTAKPATAPKRASMVTRDTLWKCDGGVCSANRAGSRDAIVCEMVVQRVGALESFTAAGKEFDEASLKTCNARAG